MKKPTVVIGGIAAAAVAATIVLVGLRPERPALPAPADCQEMRVHMEQDFAMRLRAERRQMLKDAAAVVKKGLMEQKVRNPQAAAPPEVENLIHDLDRRAAE